MRTYYYDKFHSLFFKAMFLGTWPRRPLPSDRLVYLEPQIVLLTKQTDSGLLSFELGQRAERSFPSTMQQPRSVRPQLTNLGRQGANREIQGKGPEKPRRQSSCPSPECQTPLQPPTKKRSILKGFLPSPPPG